MKETDEIRKELSETSVPDEMKAAYLLAEAVRTIVEVQKRRIAMIYRRHGLRDGENRVFKGIARWCEAEKRAAVEFMKEIEPAVIGATFERENGEKHPESYDMTMRDANELCRLTLLYIDRCGSDMKNSEEVFRVLKEMKSQEIYTEEDVARYELR